MAMICLETERLVLRALEQADWEDVCKLLQDDETMYAYEGALSDAEVQAWIDRQHQRYVDDGFGLWALVRKADGALIGQAGLTMQDYAGGRVPEIGYLLRKDFWHCGYAIEAASACKAYAFDVLGLPRVYSIIRDTNLASQRVAIRNGMLPVARFVKHYRGVDMPHLVFEVENRVVES